MEISNLQVWIAAIGNVGFPIVLSIYLLIRFEKKMDLLQCSIQSVRKLIRNTLGK